MAHVLGGTFGLPHAEAHTALLPHSVHFNASAAPEAMAKIARGMGLSDQASQADPSDAIFQVCHTYHTGTRICLCLLLFLNVQLAPDRTFEHDTLDCIGLDWIGLVKCTLLHAAATIDSSFGCWWFMLFRDVTLRR